MNDGSNANSRLTVKNCVFDGNSADFMGGGILNFSTSHSANLTVSNCIFTNNSAENGGGIVNYVGFDGAVTATVNDTTFTGNSAALGRGGAIHNDSVAGSATMRVSNCTITNNSANFYGGVSPTAAGAWRSAITLTGNSAAGSGGGVYTEYDEAEVHISNCTLSGNSADFHGGGIYTQPEASVAITNTILKTGASGENLYGGIISHGHNLSNDAAGGDNSHGPGGLLNQPGDIRNTDPQIGPLANNGGLTKTMALLPNSPAINAGNDAVAPPRDQRGYLRSGTSDIGAFEFGGIIPAALGNISTRAFVQTGDNVMIGGFIVQGTGPKRVIIRAIGPELSQFGVPILS
jgi:predicted outer membrane repeat protein